MGCWVSSWGCACPLIVAGFTFVTLCAVDERVFDEMRMLTFWAVHVVSPMCLDLVKSITFPGRCQQKIAQFFVDTFCQICYHLCDWLRREAVLEGSCPFLHHYLVKTLKISTPKMPEV